MPELYDIFYNGQFVCRVIGALLKAEMNFLSSSLSFEGPESALYVKKVEPAAPEKEPAEEAAKAKK